MVFDWFWFVVLVYVIGFVLTFLYNINIGPVAAYGPGLALLRASVWPYWVVTGRPFGQRMPMD